MDFNFPILDFDQINRRLLIEYKSIRSVAEYRVRLIIGEADGAKLN